jgi:hypothetical protein
MKIKNFDDRSADNKFKRDKVLIQRVMINLLKNAMEIAPE